eukprot:768580-Hanusia_phi.AAC.9
MLKLITDDGVYYDACLYDHYQPPVKYKQVGGEEGDQVSLQSLHCCLRVAVIESLNAVLETSSDLFAPKVIYKSFELNLIVDSLVEIGSLLGLDKQTSRSLLSHLDKRKPKTAGLKLSPSFSLLLRLELFRLFHFLNYLKDLDVAQDCAKHLSRLEQEAPKCFKHLKKHTSEVELQRKDVRSGQLWLERILFVVDPRLRKMSHNSHLRDNMLEMIGGIPTNERYTKFSLLIKGLRSLNNKILWFEVFGSKAKMDQFLYLQRWVNKSTLALSVLISCLLLIIYGIPIDPNTHAVLAGGSFYSKNPPAGYSDAPYPFAQQTSNPQLAANMSYVIAQSDLSLKYRLLLISRWSSSAEWQLWPEGRHVTLMLCCLHLALTLVQALSYLVLEFPVEWMAFLEEEGSKERKERKEDSEEESSSQVSRFNGRKYLMSMPELPRERKASGRGWLPLRILKQSYKLWYVTGLTTMSLLGVISSPFFQVLCMLDYFQQPGGKLVTRSIVVGGPALIRSFAVGLIFLAVYGFLGYAYMSDIAIEARESCHSPFQCVSKFVIDSFGGDLRTVVGTSSAWSFPALVVYADLWDVGRSLFILSSIIFWSFLLQPVVTGQIIDAFRKIRKVRRSTESYLKSRCFISGSEEFKFHDFPGEWEKREGGKYVWNYLYLFRKLLHDDDIGFSLSVQAAEALLLQDKIDLFPNGSFWRAVRRAASQQAEQQTSQKLPEEKEMRAELAERRVEVSKFRDRYKYAPTLLSTSR